MRNLVYLGLLSLVVVFVLAVLPKFAIAGVAVDECGGPIDISCDTSVDSDTCLGADDDDIAGACVWVDYDLDMNTNDDFLPSGCGANHIQIGVKATDDGVDNPCAEASANLEPDDCTIETIGDDDDFVLRCHAFFEGFQDPTSFTCASSNAVISSSKLAHKPASGGKPNGVKKGPGGGHGIDSSLCVVTP